MAAPKGFYLFNSEFVATQALVESVVNISIVLYKIYRDAT